MAMMKNELNLPLILTVGVISVLLLILSGIGTEAWFLNEEQYELAAKWDEAPNSTLANIRKEQQAKISGDGWTDSEKKFHPTIPITKAMDVLVTQYKGNLPASQPSTQPAASVDSAPAIR